MNVREYQRGKQQRTTQRNWQHRVHKTKKTKQKQSRETGNIVYIRRRKQNKNNPEKLAT